jgi:hypothetical protein
VWKFLLGVYPADSTTEQRRALREAKAAEYAQLKQQWQTISRPQAQRFAKWREVRAAGRKFAITFHPDQGTTTATLGTTPGFRSAAACNCSSCC